MVKKMVPTMDYGISEVHTTAERIVQYITRFYFLNPGDISTTFPNMISFRNTVARCDEDPHRFILMAEEELTRAVVSALPEEDDVQVNLKHIELEDTDVGYGVKIEILTSYGTPLLPLSMVTLGEIDHSFINFKQLGDQEYGEE